MTKAARTKKPKRRWFRDMTPADYVLSAIGLALGTFAAVFPWHVYLNPEDYGPPRMTFSRGGVIPQAEIAAQEPGAPADAAGPRSGEAATSVARARPAVDPVTTGKVDRGAVRQIETDQPYPGNGRSFQVLAVDGARALVGDSDGVYLVRAGSRLPDDTVAQSFRQDGTGWYILTADGRQLRP